MVPLRVKTGDYIFIGVLVLAGLLGLWSNLGEAGASGGRYAVITLENQPVAVLSLAPGEDFAYHFSFGPENEHEAIVEVVEGRVRMLDLGQDLCPRGICSHTGWISRDYESIVCLPNRIMITIDEDYPGDIQDLDGITY